MISAFGKELVQYVHRELGRRHVMEVANIHGLDWRQLAEHLACLLSFGVAWKGWSA